MCFCVTSTRSREKRDASLLTNKEWRERGKRFLKVQLIVDRHRVQRDVLLLSETSILLTQDNIQHLIQNCVEEVFSVSKATTQREENASRQIYKQCPHTRHTLCPPRRLRPCHQIGKHWRLLRIPSTVWKKKSKIGCNKIVEITTTFSEEWNRVHSPYRPHKTTTSLA